MTRQFDHCRHNAGEQQQQQQLTWDRVSSEDQYQRVDYPYGGQYQSGRYGGRYQDGGAYISGQLGPVSLSVGVGDSYGGRYQNGVANDYYDPRQSAQARYSRYADNTGYYDPYSGTVGYQNGGYQNGGRHHGHHRNNSFQVYADPGYQDYGYQIPGSYNNYNNYNDGYSYNGQIYRPQPRYYDDNDGYSYNGQIYRPQPRYNDNGYYDDGYQSQNYRPQPRYYDNGSSYYNDNQNGRYNDNSYNSGYNDGYNDGYRARNGQNNRQNYYDNGYGDPRGYNDPRYGQNNRQNYYDNGYGDPRGYNDPRYGYNDSYYNNNSQYDPRYNQGGDWNRMRNALYGMLGHSVREYNPNVDERLGCATFVSAALNKGYGLPIHDTDIGGLENSLRRCGYHAVPVSRARPGDPIIAHRRPGQPGHAAIYVGNGKIVNNSSSQRRVIVASLNNFGASDYTSVMAYQRDA